MARTIDLTDKLGLAGKPTITIGDVTLEVNDGTVEMLQLMELFGESGIKPSDTLAAAELLLSKDGVDKLQDMKLSLRDFMTVIEAAMDLVTGGAEGEVQTQDTTS